MEVLSGIVVGFIICIYIIASIFTFGRVKLILAYKSSTKINYYKWYIDIGIALLLAIFLPIPFVIFHEMTEDYSHFKGMNFKVKRPEFDDIAWQECDTSTLNSVWTGIDHKMGKYLGVL